MNRHHLYQCILLQLIFMTASLFANGEPIGERRLTVIPKPHTINELSGHFRITKETRIIITPENQDTRNIAEFLVEKIHTVSGFQLAVSGTEAPEKNTNIIHLIIDNQQADLAEEGYQLTVNSAAVVLTAYQPRGLFFAVQTLRQLLPPEFENQEVVTGINWDIPALEIEDHPRFPWRGMMLDCGRHFMEKEFIKRYIDLLAYHKMNVFHWHLTEDQGWRIEIKKYPRLTEVGAWRTYEDGSVYGGFYTQEDIREVVEYARKRYITVVPEIEMPGHAVAALASYPELSCTDGPFNVETQWGVFKDVYCAGDDHTFAFLEDVLNEVIELFPGTYLHIGGDECPKDRWAACDKCQQRIKSEGLKDEHELQSYFIKRIESFLESKNRRLIGWDEILEGGLAEGATVQSWRGMDGAIAAATSGHDAIVSPTSHAYFDYDVSVTDLRKVYTFDPVPPGLTPAQEKHILGGQFNMWTERAPQEFIDSKVFPRMLAMAEVLWSPEAGRRYEEFHPRVQQHYPRLDALGVKYGVESRPVLVYPTFNADKKRCLVTVEAGEPGLALRYSVDGSDPGLHSSTYTAPLEITSTTTFKAAAFKNERQYGDFVQRKFFVHQAVGVLPELAHPYNAKYDAGGQFGLTDGIRGTNNFRDGLWQGFERDDLEAIIDLGEVKPIQRISSGYLQDINSWIFLPLTVEYSVSTDGEHFEILWAEGHNISLKNQDAVTREFTYEPEKLEGRYVKVRAVNIATCPDWHPGAGGKAWVFTDEIIVE